MPKRRFKPFDTSAFLDDDEVIAEYLTAALEDRDPDVFLTAVGQVAKARGLASIAARSGLGRESLYKALAPGAKPPRRTRRPAPGAYGPDYTGPRPADVPADPSADLPVDPAVDSAVDPADEQIEEIGRAHV